ncbi:hypothetical protein [Nocardia blacklockiae]|uniref:hypothetical protein n=1 Tax=Nocardia blacklockiae TaxID=480036 RepID=UPI0018949A3B|nr:hypothetical protein [Nocardia blacklockiae]MBF6174394.1 hypothetical protein [Nocardia blacklockiae]
MPRSKKRVRKSRENRQRGARRRAGSTCLLFRSRPPFQGYDEWFPTKALVAGAQRSTVALDDPEDVEAFELLTGLGPFYDGMVPAAALELHDQIGEGVIRMARDGRPGLYTETPIAEVVEMLVPAEYADDDAAVHLHFMHAQGLLVLDEDHIVNMAMPPTKSTRGNWELNGHPDTWPQRAGM